MQLWVVISFTDVRKLRFASSFRTKRSEKRILPGQLDCEREEQFLRNVRRQIAVVKA
jgi:hypothetical protein